MNIVREPARVIASVFSLCAFLVALVAGMRAGASTSSTLLTAIVAMAVCKAIGLWAGWAGERAVREFLERYRAANPVADPRAIERALLRPEEAPGEGIVDSRVKKRAA